MSGDAGAVEAEVIDPRADADAIRELAIAQALFKVVAERVETGNPANLRGRVDAIMRRRLEDARELGLAPRTLDIEVDGAKVGTYSISTSEAGSTSVELAVENRQELLAWAVDNGCVAVDMRAVRRHVDATGEVPDGCTLVPRAVPAGEVRRTALRVDPAKVAAALGDAALGGAVAALLEGE